MWYLQTLGRKILWGCLNNYWKLHMIWIVRHSSSWGMFFTLSQIQRWTTCTHRYRSSLPLYIRYLFLSTSFVGGVTGRPKTMCPRTNVLGPLVPNWIVPCDTISLDWYIPVIMHNTIRFGWCKIAGTLCFRDNSSRGPGVPENSCWDTSFRDVPSPHPFVFASHPHLFDKNSFCQTPKLEACAEPHCWFSPKHSLWIRPLVSECLVFPCFFATLFDVHQHTFHHGRKDYIFCKCCKAMLKTMEIYLRKN